MTKIIYNSFLTATSTALNFSIKHNWWLLAEKLIMLRKKHIIKILRKEITY
jgi:hypothetical protein